MRHLVHDPWDCLVVYKEANMSNHTGTLDIGPKERVNSLTAMFIHLVPSELKNGLQGLGNILLQPLIAGVQCLPDLR